MIPTKFITLAILFGVAADNKGVVPFAIFDTNLLGKTMVDYLPGQQMLMNPFIRVRNQPSDEPAISQGEVGYVFILDNLGNLIGFNITAMGADTSQCLEFSGYLEGKDPGFYTPGL